MISVDTIVHGGIVVTMNAKEEIVADGAVAVREGQVVAVGPAATILSRYVAPQMVDCAGQVIMPGLINAHTHVPMSLLRGLADDLRLDVWLLGYMMPVEREYVGEDFCHWGTLLSCAEMIRSGVTCFNDMYYYEDAVARAVDAVGMRAILGQTILRFPSPGAASYDESLAYCRQFIERWRHHPRIVPSVAPHAPYTSTPEMLEACVNLAVEFNVPLHIHLCETSLEVMNSRKEHGDPPIAYVNRLGLFQAKVIAAHCVHLDDGEMRILANTRTGVAHNPSSNMKLASGVAPVVRLRSLGVHVGLGTDGQASNNDQDMFEEMRLAAFLPKGTMGDPTLLPARDVFAMATIEGARAVHLDHLIGSLEVGKRADLTVVDMKAPHLNPRYQLSPAHIYSHLVYAAKASDVCHVMVDGQWLLRDGQYLTIDVPLVIEKATEFAARINTFISQREQSLLDKLLAVSDLDMQQSLQESFEVQVKVEVDDLRPLEELLHQAPFEIIRRSVRQQFDTYFLFDQGKMGGYVRYREDNKIVEPEDGRQGMGPGPSIEPHYYLTVIGETKEREYADSVILSRSHYLAAAVHSLRFYQEYFQPDRVREIIKWRTRYWVRYKGEEFALNFDRLSKPMVSTPFLEIKSRTWSRADAEKKADLIGEILRLLKINLRSRRLGEYTSLAW
ncbi:MAG: amidohydrolase family protein [Anaerolineae bacterium]